MKGWRKNLIANSGKRTGLKFRGKCLICDIEGSPISESAYFFSCVISSSQVFVAFVDLTVSFQPSLSSFYLKRANLWRSNAIQFWSLSLSPWGDDWLQFRQENVEISTMNCDPIIKPVFHCASQQNLFWLGRQRETQISDILFNFHFLNSPLLLLLRKREDSQVPKRILLQARRPYLLPSISLCHICSPQRFKIYLGEVKKAEKKNPNKIKMHLGVHFKPAIGDLKRRTSQ